MGFFICIAHSNALVFSIHVIRLLTLDFFASVARFENIIFAPKPLGSALKSWGFNDGVHIVIVHRTIEIAKRNLHAVKRLVKPGGWVSFGAAWVPA